MAWLRNIGAQNPMNTINEPDYYGGDGPFEVMILAIGAYALVFWLLFGPLRHWAEEHKGGAWALIAFGPGLLVLGVIFAMK